MVKRTIIITIGAITILLIFTVWLYLLFFGAPDETNDIFTNLGFAPAMQETIPEMVPIEVKTEHTVNVAEGLQQLTTKAVAGFIAIKASTSTPTIVRYVEQGTGYIFDIDLNTGEEKVISQNTFPKVRQAVFSPDGQAVALTAVTGYERNTFVGLIDTVNNKITGENIIPNANNIHLPNNHSVKYTVESEDNLLGYTYDFVAGKLRQEFVVPFLAVKVLWQEDNETYLYNKPTAELPGYLYKIKAGSYEATDIHGYSLTVENNSQFLGYSYQQNGSYQTKFKSISSGTEYDSPIVLVPEKCAFYNKTNLTQMWCANPIIPTSFDITKWYQGKISTSDYLWQVSVQQNQAVLLSDLEAVSGRPIDVKDLMITGDDTLLLFSNKLDNTLWKFDI